MQLKKHILTVWSLLVVLLRLAPALAVEQLINNCNSPLAANISVTTSPVTFTIAGASCFPTSLPAGGTFSVLIDSEWMTVTAISGTSITATRPEAPSVAATHTAPAQVWIMETARSLGQLKIDAGSPQALAYAVGTPASGQSWSVPCPYTITFPGNFTGTYPDAKSRATCGTSPSELDTWSILIGGSSVGSVQLGPTCTSTSGVSGTGVTFATTGGAAQTCNVGQQLTLAAPAPVPLQVIGTPTTITGTNATSLTLATPTGAASGDVLVACVANYSSAPGVAATTIPTGFNYATGSATTSCKADGNGGGQGCLYTNILSAAPLPSYIWGWTVAGSYPSAGMMAVRGLNTATLIDSGIGSNASVANGAAVSVPYGPTTVNDFLVTCVGHYPATAWNAGAAPPGVQALVPSATGGGVFMSLSAVSLTGPSSGNITGTLNDASSVWGGVNVPLEVGAVAPLSGNNFGFVLAGHTSALP